MRTNILYKRIAMEVRDGGRIASVITIDDFDALSAEARHDVAEAMTKHAYKNAVRNGNFRLAAWIFNGAPTIDKRAAEYSAQARELLEAAREYGDAAEAAEADGNSDAAAALWEAADDNEYTADVLEAYAAATTYSGTATADTLLVSGDALAAVWLAANDTNATRPRPHFRFKGLRETDRKDGQGRREIVAEYQYIDIASALAANAWNAARAAYRADCGTPYAQAHTVPIEYSADDTAPDALAKPAAAIEQPEAAAAIADALKRARSATLERVTDEKRDAAAAIIDAISGGGAWYSAADVKARGGWHVKSARAAAAALGISERTARYWIEQYKHALARELRDIPTLDAIAADARKYPLPAIRSYDLTDDGAALLAAMDGKRARDAAAEAEQRAEAERAERLKAKAREIARRKAEAYAAATAAEAKRARFEAEAEQRRRNYALARLARLEAAAK